MPRTVQTGRVRRADTRAADAHPSGMTISAPAAAPMSITLLHRIRGEFLEMPGLHLTRSQAARLWHLDPDTCDAALRTLIDTGFLRQTARGTFRRADDADG
jgi:hypothetical protein